MKQFVAGGLTGIALVLAFHSQPKPNVKVIRYGKEYVMTGLPYPYCPDGFDMNVKTPDGIPGLGLAITCTAPNEKPMPEVSNL